ncbi:hypothetical protein [uncultured Stenotrophomonas sp.]|uniref:hypothetical protein n=1 Tax=uncultured Stenotrophomonas sp. TaxID=165438 RepID=UPI0025DC85CF|nr:hypothetical protein [uncultured Stenotrophomonas sp.]
MRVRFGGIELGHTSGKPGDVLIENFDGSYSEIRSSDVAREGTDGVMPGRDFFGARTMSFDVATNRSTMRDARETLAALLYAWRDASIRSAPGVLVPLDYQAVDDDRWRRVYGRPRRADDGDFGVLMRQGLGRVTLEFEVMDHRSFDGGPDGERSVTVGQVEGSVGGGWSFPATFPLAGSAISGTRAGSVSVGGDAPSPALIEFRGPGQGFQLRGNRNWHVGLKSSVILADDEVITIDPFRGMVTDNFGNRRFAALDRRTPLTGVELSPGVENVFFSAVDQTRRAHAVIRWRDAYLSL